MLAVAASPNPTPALAAWPVPKASTRKAHGADTGGPHAGADPAPRAWLLRVLLNDRGHGQHCCRTLTFCDDLS